MTAARATARPTRHGRRPVGQRGVRGVLLAAGGVAALVLPALPAGAEERVVTITAEGVFPSRLEVSAGDTVRFVSQDPSFAYRAQSTGGAWTFDSGPTELLDGDYLVPTPLERPGTYTYRVAQDAPFQGTLVVPGPAGAAAPASPAPVTPAPVTPGPSAPAPVAPARAAPAVPGPLAAPATSRAFGLPVTLAALMVVGAASLVLRFLLAEAGLSDPGSTLRAEGGGRPRW